MLEGVRAPFFSANIQETTDGVFANISLIPTSNVMELAVGTSVQLFFKEITTIPESIKNNRNQWRLMFDGEFRGFNTFETAKAGAGITILCKCFRNYFRRVAMGFLFSGEFGASATTKTGKSYGVQHLTQVNIDDLSLGSFKTKVQAFVAKGSEYAASIGDEKSSVAERAFMSVMTSFWNNTKSANPMARNIGYRTKLVRKIIGFKNSMGFNSFQNADMPFTPNSIYNNMVQLFVSNSGMSMIESGIQEIANHFKFNFFHCATPTFISDIYSTEKDKDGKSKIKSNNKNLTEFTIPMADPNYSVKYTYTKTSKVGKNGKAVETVTTTAEDVQSKMMPAGNPNRLNQMMILPLIPYTAPPKCNILFPALFRSISYAVDYDSDTTRAMGLTPYAFKADAKDITNFWNAETFFYPYVGSEDKNLTPVTLDEYRKGVIPFVHTMNRTDAATNNKMNMKYLKDRVARQLKEKKKLNEGSDLKEEADKNLDEIAKKELGVQEEAFEKEAKANATTTDPPMKTTQDSKNKIVQYEYLFKKHMRRQVNVAGPFNPYSVCGFPMVLLKEDTRDISMVQIPQSMAGLLIQKTHTIDAQAMTADTTHLLSNFRPISEPTGFDLYGQPVYSKNHGLKNISEFNDSFWEQSENGINIPNETNFRTTYKTSPGDTKNGIKYRFYDDISNQLTSSNRSDREISYLNIFRSTWRLARDFGAYSQITSKDPNAKAVRASARGAWLDYFYAPQVIGKVYAGILYNKRSSDFFDGGIMMQENPNGNADEYSSYATVHEAVETKLEHKDMINKNYDEALNYIWRPICSESEFYLGIMDCISSEMVDAIKKDQPEDGGNNVPSKSDPYPNFDSDWYVPTQKYFQYGSWENFWKACKDKPDIIGLAIPFHSAEEKGSTNEDRTIDFSRQDGRCFDVESFSRVYAYMNTIQTFPFGSDKM